MTVARDAVLEPAAGAIFTTTSPFTYTFTPVGTPRGITVAIAHGTESTDLITSVSYGGVAMARVATATDTVTEPGRVYTYFLGSGIPTGAQTVSIVHTGSATEKWPITQSVTAAADTEVVTSGTLTANAADPQIALDTGATSALRNCILYSGFGATGSLTALSGMEAVGTSTSHDFGIFLGLFGQETTASSGSFAIGYSSGAVGDDVAMVAIAIQEVSAPTGTVAVNEQNDTSAITAVLTLPGVIAATEDADTSAIAGLVANPIIGTIAVTEEDDTPAIVGDSTSPPINGSIGVTEQDDTAAFAGTVVPPAVTGTIGATEEDDTASFDGFSTTPGTMVVTEENDEGSFTGTVANPVTGTISVTEQDDAGAFASLVSAPGVISATEGDDTSSFAGVVANSITGTLDGFEADDTALFIGNTTGGVVVGLTSVSAVSSWAASSTVTSWLVESDVQ